ncbi:MAG: RagB/SusD family nutrient uptake outer membrane protein [Prolixibacteraceae bacterium]
MKNIFKILTLLFAGLSLINCVDALRVGDNFLDKPAASTSLNKDSIFAKATTARYFLWNSYKDLYFALQVVADGTINNKFDGGMFESISDHFQSEIGYDAAGTTWYPGLYTQQNESDGSMKCKFPFTKARVWESVRNSWIFIENIPGTVDMAQDEKDRLSAEAKIIIASRYFDMFRHFGGLPIMKGSADMSKIDNGSLSRSTVEETVNFMIGLLDEAIASKSLPWSLSASDQANWDGRLTKGSAAGLKCKILLHAASPIFNDATPYCTEAPQDAVTNKQVWYGAFKPELWEKCRLACADFFTLNQSNGNTYALVTSTGTDRTSYRNAFRNGYLFRGSPELLISTRCNQTASSYESYNANYLFPDRTKKGSLNPTQDLVDCFPNADGTPFDTTYVYLPGNPKNINPFDNRDPRLYETVLVNGDSYKGRTSPLGGAELWQGGYENAGKSEDSRGFKQGYALYKFMLDKKTMNNIPIQYPYLRMAEIHLIYAEALAETGNLVMANAQVDIVRSRVGLKSLASCNPSLNLLTNKANFINELIRERSCELAAEDVRFFDNVRRKLVNNFTKMIYGVKIYRLNANGTRNLNAYKGTSDETNKVAFPTKFEYQRVTVKSNSSFPRSWWTTFSTKWFLSAMPSKEINKGYNLDQNPGW